MCCLWEQVFCITNHNGLLVDRFYSNFLLKQNNHLCSHSKWCCSKYRPRVGLSPLHELNPKWAFCSSPSISVMAPRLSSSLSLGPFIIMAACVSTEAPRRRRSPVFRSTRSQSDSSIIPYLSRSFHPPGVAWSLGKKCVLKCGDPGLMTSWGRIVSGPRAARRPTQIISRPTSYSSRYGERVELTLGCPGC